MGCPTPTPLSSFNRLHRSFNAWFESDTVSKTLFVFFTFVTTAFFLTKGPKIGPIEYFEFPHGVESAVCGRPILAEVCLHVIPNHGVIQ